MTSITYSKGETALEDQELADIATAYYRLQANAWLRRQLAVTMPRLHAAVLAVRNDDKKVDVRAIANEVIVGQKMLEFGE